MLNTVQGLATDNIQKKIEKIELNTTEILRSTRKQVEGKNNLGQIWEYY